jgi:glutamate-1-semialdehyde 2,1-aminomutase
MIMGHSHPEIVRAIKTQVELGTSYGAPTGLESDVAKLIKQCLPSIEKIRMVNSGTEGNNDHHQTCLEASRVGTK